MLAGPVLTIVVLGNIVFGCQSVQTILRKDYLPARVPYVFPSPGADSIADTLRTRRNGELRALDGVLLNAKSIASVWNDLAGAIRDSNSIPSDLRELLILRSGALNNAAYQWIQHEHVGRKAGLSTAQLQEIRLTPAFLGPLAPNSTLTPAQSAAMLFTDWVTESVYVPQPVYDGLNKFLNDQQMVEAVATVGVYNLVSRVLVALNVDGKMDVPVPIP